MSLALIVLLLGGADTIALKEKASVSGRWVRVLDLIDADRTDSATRLRVAEIYLGRAPEEGQIRTITVEEIRRELERRGVDPSAYSWRGEKVDVTSGLAPASEPLSRAIAFEIKRHLMERESGLRSDEVSVRIVQLRPESCPDGCEVAEIKPRGGGYVANATGTDQLLKRSPGDWNQLRFIAKGDSLKVWLNDTQVLDTSIAKYPDPAPLGLQLHPGVKMKIEFRNGWLREL